METSVHAVVLVGIIEAIKRQFPELLVGNWIVLLALVLGVGAGLLGVDGLNIQSGVIAAFLAVGGHSVATRISGK